MQPEIDAQLSNFFEDAPARDFAKVMRGYDQHQVDEYLKQTDQEMRQHRDQAQALQQELTEAHRQLREQERPTYAGLGSRIEQLLRLAEEQATEIVGEARSAANELQAAAKVDAAELRAGAENEAAELRASAKRETDDQRGSAEREADAIRTGARRGADELTSTTEREAAKLRAMADHEVAEKRPPWSATSPSAAPRPSGRSPAQGVRQAGARRDPHHLKRQADEMRSQAQRILEESEAQRAQAEAEFEIQPPPAARNPSARRPSGCPPRGRRQKLVTERRRAPRPSSGPPGCQRAGRPCPGARPSSTPSSQSNAKKNADQIVAQAKAQADQLTADAKTRCSGTALGRSARSRPDQAEGEYLLPPRPDQPVVGHPDAGAVRGAQAPAGTAGGRAARPAEGRRLPAACTAGGAAAAGPGGQPAGQPEAA